MSFNETNAWRTTRARTVTQLRLFIARICYAENWIMYGFQLLRRDSGNASHHERDRWPVVPRGAELDADAKRADGGE